MKFTSESTLHQKFLENMHDAVLILDENFNVNDCNHVATVWYGYTEEQLKKLNLSDLRAPEERAKITEHMHGVATKQGGIWETVHLRSDGSTFAVEVSSTPIEIGDKRRFYHVVRDISVRKKNEEALRASEARYKQIVEFAPDTIFIHRHEKVIFMNHAGLKLFGAENPAQIIGQSLWNLYPPERHDIVRARNHTMQKTRGAVPTIEHVVQRVDGTRFHVEATATIIDYEDEPAFFVMMRDITEKKKFERELSYLAKHDPITGLANRAFFQETLNAELLLAKTKNQLLAVIFVDIDGFNLFNEVLGHAGGDDLLRFIATRLLYLDLPAENLGRFGPQFAIILHEITTPEQIDHFITRINQVIANEIMVENQKIHVRFNYGISICPTDSDQGVILMSSASVALTKAKEIGGGAVQFCTPELNQRAQLRIKLEHGLRDALAHQELFLQYQPIIDTKTKTVAGFEALVRWDREGKPVSPADFVPIAEKTHMIIPIGEWIAKTAAQQCMTWQHAAAAPIFISINISPVQFNHSNVLEMLTKVLEHTRLDPGALKIEVTESVLMHDVQKSIHILHEIKQLGIKISIDDFGTGYSSLNYLRHLPIDYIKIDQSFVRDMTTNANDAAIVKTIVDLAHNLNYQLIAEGVETEEQLQFLTKLGCHYIQGYYFSKPLSDSDATQFLQKRI